jgi:CRISPR-associated (Cas) DxTHG family
MAKKVFISFLGAIPYGKTQYYFATDKALSTPTSYVQEAIFEKYLFNFWGANDKIFIFTTTDAYNNNYINRIERFDAKTQTPIFSPNKDGLESILKKWDDNKRIAQYDSISIANGNTVEEIWSVFQTIYDQLKDLPVGSEIYFDITFGFRSLPMLGIVLLNYVQTMQNVVVKYIFYGNYEVGRHEKTNLRNKAKAKGASDDELKKLDEQPPQSPILDLRAFAELQDWTTGAQAFLNGGSTNLLKNLIAQKNPQLANDLDAFAQSILMCRGQQLNQDLDIDSLKSQIVNLQSQTIQAQLRPLLERIEQKIQPFNSQNTLNGIQAVEWCVNNGLIQQGYTFLQETLKSYVIEHVFSGNSNLQSYILHKEMREAAHLALNGATEYKIRTRLLPGMPDKSREMKTFVTRIRIVHYYRNLTGDRGLRNDINHCGFKANYEQPDDLIVELRQLLTNVKACLGIL